MITVVNYGSGNIKAIQNIFKRLKIPTRVASTRAELATSSKMILPGVGAFDHAMLKLEQSGMKDELNRLVLSEQVPIMGICVGMQIMSFSSEEGEREGLGWIPGHVKKFLPEDLDYKPHVPHMGWNLINPRTEHPIFTDVALERGFYFLHSFYFEADDAESILSTSHYGRDFTSGIQKNSIYGFQFHPEKSHANGIAIFRNFAELS